MTRLAILLVLVAASLCAQEKQEFVRVDHVQLKPDLAARWRIDFREVVQAWEGSERGGLSVWKTAVGHGDEYWILSRLDRLPDIEDPGWLAEAADTDSARLLEERLNAATQARRRLVLRFLRDLSIVPESPKVPRHLLVWRRLRKPGSYATVDRYYRDKILPVRREAGYRALYAASTFAGEDIGYEYMARPLDTLDAGGGNPVARLIGAQGVLDLMTPFWAMHLFAEKLILEHIPELSLPRSDD